MTATATITAKYINPPRNGNPRASWSIKDERGDYWGFYPDKVGKPEQGRQITVEWKEREYGGKTYKDITAILGTSGDTGPTAPRPASTSGSAPAASNGYRKTDPDDAIRMWVCSLINAGIQAGTVDPYDGARLTDAGLAAKEAYRNLFGLSIHN